MSDSLYSLSILKYVHSAIARESINIGTLLYSPKAKYLDAIIDSKYGVLSSIFRGFSPENYKEIIGSLNHGLERIRRENLATGNRLFDLEGIQEIFGKVKLERGLEIIQHSLVPDCGLTIQFEDSILGYSDDLNKVLQSSFERYVTNQRPEKHSEFRDDAEIWSEIKNSNKDKAIINQLHKEEYKTDLVEISFDHVFPNEADHIFQPFSLDYSNSSSLQEKAVNWSGTSFGLKDYSQKQLRFYFFVVKPQKPENLSAYGRALKILASSYYKPEIIKEDEVSDFLNDFSREHKIHVHG